MEFVKIPHDLTNYVHHERVLGSFQIPTLLTILADIALLGFCYKIKPGINLFRR